MLTHEEKIQRSRLLLTHMEANNQLKLAVWVGDDGNFRVGHSDDMRTMLDDLDYTAFVNRIVRFLKQRKIRG